MGDRFNRISPLGKFGLVASLLALLRLAFSFPVPLSIAPILNILSTFIFVGLPLFGLYLGAKHSWRPAFGLLFTLLGVVIQVGFGYLTRYVPGSFWMVALAGAISQTGLLIWCLGLGATVACLIKDKNLILPVALFLAGFDAFLVLTPNAPTAKILATHPEVFQAVASKVPMATVASPTGVTPQVLAFIGPADFIFTATFFALLFKFALRDKETIKWLVPVMVIYMAVVMLPFGLGMLPALVPIGATVLIVNRKEFALTSEEKQGTIGAAVVALALAGFGFYQRINVKRVTHVEPLNSVSGQEPPKPAK